MWLGMWLKALAAWKERHPVWFELSVSVLLGVLIEIGLTVFQPPTLLVVRRVGDDTADRMIRLAERTTGRLAASPTFAFIDIDDATWASWNFPLVTPRDKIATLLDRARRSHPLAILLDVDLAWPDPGEGQDALAKVLASYEPDAPPLLLVRSLIDVPKERLPRLRLTPYEDAVAGKANILFASPLFERDGDGNVRRWRLFAETCRKPPEPQGAPEVTPSMHLAAAMIARQALYGSPPDAAAPPLARMSRALAPFRPATCASGPVQREATLSDWPADIPIRVAPDEVSKRVIYRVAWTPGAVGLGPAVESRSGGETELVAVRPARLALAGDTSAPLPGLDGRIVVIGGSYASSGDWHDTPLGRMPGSLMIINAVEALAMNGTPREPSLRTRTATSFLVIVVASLATSFLRGSVAALAFAGVIFLLMVVSIASFQSGTMLDLAIPAVGAFLHDIAESAYSAIREVFEQGWRWPLKARKETAPESGPEENAGQEGAKE
jgi:CHASE2 domain-containing sensor protein